ncbi:twin-arginine translocase TatA/TatE family subunit [Microbacterium trichothecenolyticum]|uniref:Sec-independent protein translocase protein TatA n=1 Tax=Microbacterium trichothecenolyticum TaxID=69370 RepID=A0ABU0TWD2_MICTR|nr:twin-arginine translocase TatA/TatE family subunit [Microbacterium trichothecenolyticum]MDQ1123244.1 sec-independent protein translocase protein TatA [Microbacterium trichothecenolyticum]
MGIFGNAFSGWHLILILAVIILLFGATKLPGLAKSVGESVRILRTETAGEKKLKAGEQPAAADADAAHRRDPGPSTSA